MSNETGNSGKQRLVSIDAFRGFTIAGMILVLNPGNWKINYPILKHADWHGWTIADLVFPFFLFIVGVSITFSFSKNKIENLNQGAIYFKIIKRAVILFIIGLFLNSFPDFDFNEFRLMGVLQRIAICYAVVSILYLNTKYNTQAVIAVALLFIYWALMAWIPLPGNFIGSYEKGESVATYFDKLVLKGLMGYYEKLGEPEGIISTLPSLSTTLFGVLAGYFLKLKKEAKITALSMFIVGAILFITGFIWDKWLPINKHLWTSSFSILTAGLALILFSMFYYVIDGIKYQKWAKPFIVLGMNAITVYVLSILLGKVIKMITFSFNGIIYHPRSWLYEAVLVGPFGKYGASLAYALLYITFWCAIMWILYKKKIFIKV